MSQPPAELAVSLPYHYYAVLTHPSAPRILLTPAVDGWSPPHWPTAALHYWQSVAHINQHLRDTLGISATTLCCLMPSLLPDSSQLTRVHLLELHSQDWTPPAASRWIDRAALMELPLAQPQLRPLLETYLAEAESGVPATLPDWMRPGWFATASEWLHVQCAGLGRSVSGPVEQVRTWERSCVLRADTDAGAVYLKAVPSMFAHEPRLTRLLAAHDPAHCVPLLTLDDARGWLLLPDLGERSLADVVQIERWEEALRSLARIQLSLVELADTLVALGCAYRPLEVLAAQIDLLHDPATLQPGSRPHFTADELTRLRTLAPQLQAACAELDRLGLPPTLEHGDLGASNVSVSASHIRFFDWSDSSVAHPFFSTLLLLEDAAEVLRDVPGWRERLRSAYLEPWAVFAPLDRLVAAFELAQPLAALHHAVGYQRYVLPEMARRWEMHYMPPYYLRLLLRLTDDWAGVVA